MRHSVTLNSTEERLLTQLLRHGILGRSRSEIVRRLFDDQLFKLLREGMLRLK